MYSIKPLDENAVKEAAECGLIVTVEDHQKVGGLGSAVCECVCRNKPCKVVTMGMESFGRSGPSSELFKLYGLDADAIVKTVKENI